MPERYAVPVASDAYKKNPTYTSVFSPLIHKKTVIADHATVQCQLDLYGEEGVGRQFGNVEANAGNFVSLCAPNTLPERLAIVAYTIEYAFLHESKHIKHL